MVEKPAGLIDAARRAMTLESPNIVQVLEVTESDGESYVVTEYVEGNSLRSLMKQNAEVSVWDATDIARQICSAIDHARLRHLAHRNLTPANIMIEWDGAVKIMDYETLTEPRRKLSRRQKSRSPPLLSPEQARGEEPDWRSNLFSLGAMLYELLTRQKAFPGEDARAILENITGKEPKAPHLLKATLNPGLSCVIMKALSKTPEGRYQSGTELIHDFENRRKPAADDGGGDCEARESGARAEEDRIDALAGQRQLVEHTARAYVSSGSIKCSVRPDRGFEGSKSSLPANFSLRSEQMRTYAAPGSPRFGHTAVPVRCEDNSAEHSWHRKTEESKAEDSQNAVNAAQRRRRSRKGRHPRLWPSIKQYYSMQPRECCCWLPASDLGMVSGMSFGLTCALRNRQCSHRRTAAANPRRHARVQVPTAPPDAKQTVRAGRSDRQKARPHDHCGSARR